MFHCADALSAADNKQKIGELGDKAWSDLISKYKKDGKYAELTDAAEIVGNIKIYEGKLMEFPKINFRILFLIRNITSTIIMAKRTHSIFL